jgi:hypothetical protein
MSRLRFRIAFLAALAAVGILIVGTTATPVTPTSSNYEITCCASS